MSDTDTQTVKVVFPDGHEEWRELNTAGWYWLDLRTGIQRPLGEVIADAKKRDAEAQNAQRA